jgi:hypothetical protein
MNPILDFNDNGGAFIEIPQIDSDYSLVINHWKRTDIQLQEIEKDLHQSCTEQQTCFLKKYAEELQKFKEQFLELDLENDEEWEEEKAIDKNEKNKFIVCEEGESHLHIRNFDLKHSLAWYLMNCVSSEIGKIEDEIEKQKGISIAISDIEKTFKIIRESKSEYKAITELVKHFSLSKLQAKAIVELSLRELSQGQELLRSKIKFFQSQKSFLEKL